MNFTVDSYIKELDKRVKKIGEANVIFGAAAATHRKYVKRIFEEGLNCNNSPHGNYSTRSTYINTVTNSPKALSPKGKTGKAKFANGQSHKSTYFSKGYRQFKQRIGRGSKVNFRLFDDLKLDLTTGLRKVQGKVIAEVKRAVNAKKVRSLKDKYGECSFRFTKKEREFYLKILSKKLFKIMSGA